MHRKFDPLSKLKVKMIRCSVLLLVIWSKDISCGDITNGTELVLTFLVHRHGDRTPLESTISFSTDPDTLEELTSRYGYGQLTIAGKRRAFELGKFIRRRYYELLSPKYNTSEVYVRSTDVTRTKMTILTALAAIYPPTGERWDPDIAWDPVPYTTVPVKYDFNTAMVNCPKFMSAYYALYTSSAPEVTAKFSRVLNMLTYELGINITNLPALVYPIYDVFTSQLSLGLELGPKLDAILNDIEDAADECIDLTFGVKEFIHLQAGVLLDEFYTYAEQVITGEDTPRLRIYSANDFNVYSFEAVTKVNRQGVPKYASAYALELRRLTSNGNYVVLPVYLPSPGEEVVYLQVEGCDVLCDYDRFVELTEGNSIDINLWRDECGFSEDLEVDESSFG